MIIDDDEFIRLSIKMMLEEVYETVNTLDDPKKLIPELNQKSYDIILLDMNFRQGETGGKEGLYWLEMISIQSPETSVIMITAYGDVSLAVEAIKKGAIDFIVKPWQNEKMLATVSASFKLSNEKKKVSKLTSTQQALSNTLNEPYAEMIGNSNAIKEVFTVIEKVAGTDADVLILGENGTGKELIARSIHRQSPRRDKVFISVDAGALSESLFESELFGHVKGAFTDAVSERRGRFEIADGGTIFLDEIGNINLTQQAKLLSVLQNREVTPIGSNKAISIDVRVLCATNCDIVQLVREGKFREDLLYRINTVEIKVPPLRERLDDMKELADFFLKKFNHRYKKDVVMNEEVIDYLRKYSWPGNIRVTTCFGKSIDIV